MSNKTIKFEIATPESVVFKEEIKKLVVPTKEGELTILPDHESLISIIKPGVIEAEKTDGAIEIMSISGGFLEVVKGKIVILADTAERAQNLNEERIREARARAEELKQDARSADNVNFTELSLLIEKELARGKAVARWRKLKNLDPSN